MVSLTRSRRRVSREQGLVLEPPPIGAPGRTVALPARAGLGHAGPHLRDELTGLGGPFALRIHLEHVIERFQPFGLRPALLLIDLDRFAGVNAAFGRATGDQVLQAVAGRLTSLLPGEYATYRTGGDEFVALLDSIAMVDAVSVATELQSQIAQPVAAGGAMVPVSASVAVVMLGQRHRVDALLRDADVTMYRAKVEGGNRVDVYNWEVDSWSTARRRRVEQLEREVEDLRRKNAVLAEAVTHDLVTGLPNAVAFDADHMQIDAWRSRSGQAYSVLRVRIDGVDELLTYFRSPDGSATHVAVSHAIRDTVRQSDRAYLLDEGEYAVLLRGSVMKQALGAAGRIRSGVAALGLAHPDGSGRVLSVTVAAVEAGFRHSGPPEVLAEVEDLLRRSGSAAGQILWPR